ncbi:MAG: hypothetical protein KJ579_01945 [Verrucomicrobia bacterium]|nr:hypothetical protein [Verrucomicrobiota bacterium]
MFVFLSGAGCSRGPAFAVRAAVTNGDVRVEVALSTNVLRIGEPVTARLSVGHPAGAVVTLDEPGRSNAVRVLDRRWSDPVREGARARTEAVFRLTSFEIGGRPAFTGAVHVAAGTAAVASVAVPELALTVESALSGDEKDLRPVKGPVDWPPALPRGLWVFPLVALLALVAALAAVRLLRRVRAPAPPPPLPPAHDVALADLHRLLSRGWIEAGEAEPFYIELSRIVRAYIERRFGLHAPERTTEEFIREASASVALSPEHRRLTCGFLEHSDLVKFARARPGAGEMQAAVQAAERLVRETIPLPRTGNGRP